MTLEGATIGSTSSTRSPPEGDTSTVVNNNKREGGARGRGQLAKMGCTYSGPVPGKGLRRDGGGSLSFGDSPGSRGRVEYVDLLQITPIIEEGSDDPTPPPSPVSPSSGTLVLNSKVNPNSTPVNPNSTTVLCVAQIHPPPQPGSDDGVEECFSDEDDRVKHYVADDGDSCLGESFIEGSYFHFLEQ